MPPLRERPQDIPIIARHLLAEAVEAFGKAVRGFTPEALDCLCAHAWPGNVRELRNEVQRMLALTDGPWLGAELLRPQVRMGCLDSAGDPPGGGALDLHRLEGSLRERVEGVEALILREAMIRLRWNKTRVARELGLSRVGLRAKLRRYGLDGEGGDAGAGEARS